MKQYLEIEDVFAREILDSRGNPTVEVEVIVEVALLVVQQFLPEHQLVLLRPLNYAMVTRAVILEKVYQRQ